MGCPPRSSQGSIHAFGTTLWATDLGLSGFHVGSQPWATPDTCKLCSVADRSLLVFTTPSTPVRLLLAGDSVLSSAGLRAQLDQVPDVDVLGIVDELDDISRKVKEVDPRRRPRSACARGAPQPCPDPRQPTAP